jgi:hypothetical protein
MFNIDKEQLVYLTFWDDEIRLSVILDILTVTYNFDKMVSEFALQGSDMISVPDNVFLIDNEDVHFVQRCYLSDKLIKIPSWSTIQK